MGVGGFTRTEDPLTQSAFQIQKSLKYLCRNLGPWVSPGKTNDLAQPHDIIDGKAG